MKLGRVCWWQECVEDGYLMDIYLYPNLRLTSTKGPSDLHGKGVNGRNFTGCPAGLS
jgi:hypothetical protein